MTNHDYDEDAMNKHSEAIVRLEKEIQNQNLKFVCMENKHREKVVIMNKLIAGLLDNNNSMKTSLLEVEQKYNASVDMIKKLMGEGDTMQKECDKELQHLKVMNSDISHDMECIKKDNEQMSKELKENEALNDKQQKNLTKVIQKNVKKISYLYIAALKQQDDCKNVLKLVKELQEQNQQFNAKMLEPEIELSKKRKLDSSMFQVYQEILTVKGMQNPLSQSWSDLWSVKAPSKTLAFGWKACLDRIQTRGNLMSRNITLHANSLLCPMRSLCGEDAPHLLFTCQFAYAVWSMIYQRFGFYMVLPSKFWEHFEQHKGLMSGRKKKGKWRVIWIATIWAIWKHRNDVVFNNKVMNVDIVVDQVMMPWKWLKAKEVGFSATAYEWEVQPMLCIR